MNDYSEIIAALEKGAEEQPELLETVDLCCKLLEIQSRFQVPMEADVLKPEEARARLQRGDPLLSIEELDIDAGRLTDLAMQISFAVAECRRERVRQLADIHAWLHRRRDRMRTLAIIYLNGGVLPESNSGIDGGLLAFVMHNALHPFLRARAQSLSRLVDASSWYRGYCPVCGGEPDMAALEKGGGRRRLLCSRCDAEWPFRRLGCPFCGNDDPKEMAFLPGEDKGHHLAICERCRRYLKTVDFRETAERPLAAERVLTAGMDASAQGTGYRARA
ncbi:MAG: formate dehydrogenase accessory protein FdhE [Dehalococcoidia bacterium]|jgi:FdhE protein